LDEVAIPKSEKTVIRITINIKEILVADDIDHLTRILFDSAFTPTISTARCLFRSVSSKGDFE